MHGPMRTQWKIFECGQAVAAPRSATGVKVSRIAVSRQENTFPLVGSDLDRRPNSISTSRNFPDWLQSSGGSLAITTYQAGKIILLGLSAEGRLSAVLRDFPRCMGAAATADGRSLFLATHVQIYRLNNILPVNASQSGHDGIYAPHVNWVTGDLDVHDIGVGRDGRPIFANRMAWRWTTVRQSL